VLAAEVRVILKFCDMDCTTLRAPVWGLKVEASGLNTSESFPPLLIKEARRVLLAGAGAF